jgi:alginate O-acetyltransferase complex protein AlgI
VLFNSFEFLVFIAPVLGVYFAALPFGLERARKGFLIAASYVFYMAWNPPFVLLLLASTLLDFCVGLGLGRASSTAGRRGLLGLSLAGNLGILGYFKYGNFFAENAYSLFGREAPHAAEIILPIGISFYTFQTLSYSIDVYRGRLRPTRSLLDFALYVAFFPQLVAGPIVRAGTFLPQLRPANGPKRSDWEEGLARIAIGALKKVVVADTLGTYVDSAFANPGGFGAPGLLLAVYAFAYQIYFDFSGYSDIAIGLGRLFGFRLPENFDRPYLASSPREFWRRWHITLSAWLRDYLYVPLGGNRPPRSSVHMRLLVTMLLGGLWHGAAWTFVLWGTYHGAWLVVHRALFGDREEHDKSLPLVVRRFATFHFVCIGWILFRAESLEMVGAFAAGFTVWQIPMSPVATQTALFVLASMAAHVASAAGGARGRIADASPWLQGSAYAAIAILVFLFAPSTGRFIYFQF